jgi:Domain of unknown function (DUF4249)
MKTQKTYLLLLVAAIFLVLQGCEKDITLELPKPEERLVLEGYIQQDEFPFLVITKNFSFFSGVDFDNLNDLYVKDADVVLTVDGKDYIMQNFCLSTLPQPLKELVLSYLGLNEDDLQGLDICAYISLDVTGEIGKTYNLKVDYNQHHLKAKTVIPNPAPIDSIWYTPDNTFPDSLVKLWVKFEEPDTFGNYYRYLTKVNSEPFYAGYFGSVWDDRLTNGQTFNFTLDKGYPRNSEIDFETYGLFRRGDTIILNINMIDYGHYRFWETMEAQMHSGGPMTSPSIIISNVENGLGIWGGNGAVYDTLIVPK